MHPSRPAESDEFGKIAYFSIQGGNWPYFLAWLVKILVPCVQQGITSPVPPAAGALGGQNGQFLGLKVVNGENPVRQFFRNFFSPSTFGMDLSLCEKRNFLVAIPFKEMVAKKPKS